MENQGFNQTLDHSFRLSYRKLMALFLSKYGTENIEDIENAIMDAYYKAMKTWPYKGIPEKTDAWLYVAAKNSLLNDWKRQKKVSFLEEDFDLASDGTEEFLENNEIQDPELKLLFLVCHPKLKKEDRLVFMLKTLAGFGDLEISNALMLKKATIKKRLLRAKAEIKKQQLQFEWPEENDLKSRIDLVHTSLYLLFNEGFYSSHPEHSIRKDLCLEAMRLCKYLVDQAIANMDTYALMSLMCYHISRFQSRLDEEGNLVLLKDQDRSKWDAYFIKLGGHYLEKSAGFTTEKTKFQIEAFISAQHCLAKDLESTDWNLLKLLYKALYQRESQDLVLLNLIVVHLQLKETQEAKRLFDQIVIADFKGNKSIYYMVGVELYEQLKDQFQIELMLERAIQSSEHPQKKKVLTSKLNHIRGKKQKN